MTIASVPSVANQLLPRVLQAPRKPPGAWVNGFDESTPLLFAQVRIGRSAS